MTATLIDGKGIAARLREQTAERVAELRRSAGSAPHLAAVLVGEDPGSAIYVRNKQRACEQAGIESTLHRLAQETTQDELLEIVARLNADESVHGILVQLPLPDQIAEQAVLDAVHPIKDVDCFHPENVGLLVQGRPRFQPCTPAGVRHLLIECGAEIAGAHVVVLGRSEIVGKPMALLLMQRGPGADATVTVCHSRTRDLPEIVRSADIVIAAVGRPRFVTAEMLKPACIVIDVGTNRVDGKLTGDVDFEPAREVASAITPVPGGVGPMTIAMLLENTLTAARIQSGASS